MGSERPSARLGRLQVLVVEDEMMVALLVESMLAELGHDVAGPVGQLDAALQAARHEAIDLAILDININGGEVYPVADLLASRGIPFVFSTGYGRAGLPPRHKHRPTLHKPYRLDDMRAAIDAACASAAGREDDA